MKTPPTASLLEGATLSLAQAARRLGISEAALRDLLGRGVLTFLEIAGELRVPTLQVETYSSSMSDTGKEHAGGKPPQRKRKTR